MNSSVWGWSVAAKGSTTAMEKHHRGLSSLCVSQNKIASPNNLVSHRLARTFEARDTYQKINKKTPAQ